MIEIPEKFQDLIESCEKTRSEQARKYGPFEEVYDIRLKGEYDKDRVLDFCQKCCHKCSRTEAQLNEIKRDRELSFNEVMEAVVEGSYVLHHDSVDKKKVTYKWSQDYLD